MGTRRLSATQLEALRRVLACKEAVCWDAGTRATLRALAFRGLVTLTTSEVYPYSRSRHGFGGTVRGCRTHYTFDTGATITGAGVLALAEHG